MNRQPIREKLREWAWLGGDDSFMSNLTVIQKQVLYAKYKDGLSFQQVAKRLNYSDRQIRRIEAKAFENMS